MADLIDRTHRLYTDEFGECNPDRIHVMRSRITSDWIVWRGNKALHRAPTHAEAIRWAQANARIGLHAYIGGRYVGQVGEIERRETSPEPRITYTFPEPMEAP